MTRQPGLTEYGGLAALPEIVASAVRVSRDLGFDKACMPEVGRLLHILVAARPGARIGETGTGCGVGSAWMASAMDPTSTLVTVEVDPDRAATARRLLSSVPHVEVLTADWSLLKTRGPFDVLFIDGGPPKHECDEILGMMSPRGIAIFDDLTPEHRWTQAQRATYANGDPVRDAWLGRSDCAALELMVTQQASVLLVARGG